MVRRLIALPVAALVISTLILGGISLALDGGGDEPRAAKTVTTLEQTDGVDDVYAVKKTAGQQRATERSNGNAYAYGKDKRRGPEPTTTTTIAPAVAAPSTTQPGVTPTTTPYPLTPTTQVTTTTTKPPTTATTKPPTTTTKPPTTTTTAPPKQPPPPSGDRVDIYPGDNVSGILAAHPQGTTFLMHSGVYKRVTLMPKSGQTIIGQNGAILDGEGRTADGVGRANANNITIRNLTIRNYTDKCIDWGAQGAGLNWTIEDTEVSYCLTGIKVKKGGTYKNNYVHHNRKYGMNGNGVNLTVVGNEIAYNRTDKSQDLGDSGGTKFLRTERLVIRSNHVHDNYGHGIWVDGSNQGALIEKNKVTNNERVGIFHELGFSPTIRNNTVKGNGHKTDGKAAAGSGILVLATKDANVYGNTVTGNRNGIMAKWNDLKPGRATDNLTGEKFYLKNLNVHNNVIAMNVGTTGIADLSNAKNAYTSSWNNRFAGNSYTLGSSSGKFFRWKETITYAQWKQIHPSD